MPLCRVIIACCFRVAALSSNAALALSPSGIAPELNRIQLSAICRGGQSGKVIDQLAWRCLPLGHLSAASGACAVEQISSSKRQCCKRQVSLKPALVLAIPCRKQRFIWWDNFVVMASSIKLDARSILWIGVIAHCVCATNQTSNQWLLPGLAMGAKEKGSFGPLKSIKC